MDLLLLLGRPRHLLLLLYFVATSAHTLTLNTLLGANNYQLALIEFILVVLLAWPPCFVALINIDTVYVLFLNCLWSYLRASHVCLVLTIQGTLAGIWGANIATTGPLPFIDELKQKIVIACRAWFDWWYFVLVNSIWHPIVHENCRDVVHRPI